MQHESISILSTRFLPGDTIAKAAGSNIRIDVMSFISVMPVISSTLKNTLHHLSALPLYVVFTSMNAVAAVAEQISAPTKWKIFCIAGKTKQAAARFFGENAIIGTSENATALAALIIASGKVAEVTFFCGDQHLPNLPDQLFAANIRVNEIIVYTTLPTHHIVNKNYHGILFFSPTAVHSFFLNNGIASSTVLFSIGSTTTAALCTFSGNKIITAVHPSAENILQSVISYYNTMSHQIE